MAHANRYNHFLKKKMLPFLGNRVMEAGSGIGTMSQLFLDRERLLLVDYEPLYVARLRNRFGYLSNVRIEQGDLTRTEDFQPWKDERIDTVYCSNVVEHIDDDLRILSNFCDLLVPGGQCEIIVPAVPGLYSGVDVELGHYRRYTSDGLAEKVTAAGFDVVHSTQFNKLWSIAWWFSGKVLRRRNLSPRQMIWYDRLLWLSQIMESLPGVPGMSLVMVGRKRLNSEPNTLKPNDQA